MVPVSCELSFSTIRWATLSLLRQTIELSCPTAPGLGENDCAPRSPTMLIVDGPPVDMVGTVGPPGLPLDPDPPPQPEHARTRTRTRKPQPAPIWIRMTPPSTRGSGRKSTFHTRRQGACSHGSIGAPLQDP